MNQFMNCCVKTCVNKSMPSDGEIKFYRFPTSDNQILHAWIMALKYIDVKFSPTYYSVVCSIHFKNDDYVLENGIFELSPTAVPSIFIKQELFDTGNTIDKNNEIDDSNDNLRITAYKSMIEEPEQDNRSDSVPVIVSVYGSYSATGLNLANLNSNEEHPPYNNEYQNQFSSNERPSKKLKVNNSASTSISSVPIGTISSLSPSSSLKPSNSSPCTITRPNDSITPSDSLRPSSSGSCTITSTQIDESRDIDSNPNSVWITNQTRHVIYKDDLSIKFRKRLESLAQENRRLISKSKTLMTSKQMLLDVEIKYLQLRNKVLETEEALLEKGINTSEYPVFQIAKNNVEMPKENIEHQVLLECKLAEVNNQLYNNSSESQPTKLGSGVELPSDNENSVPELA